MLEIDCSEFRVEGGCIIIDDITEDECHDIISNMIVDDCIPSEDILGIISDKCSNDVLVDYVIENCDQDYILDELAQDDILDYVFTDIDEPSNLNYILEKILDQVDIKTLESEVLNIKNKIQRREKKHENKEIRNKKR